VASVSFPFRDPAPIDCCGFIVKTPLGSVTVEGTWGDPATLATFGPALDAIGLSKVFGGPLDASNFSFSTSAPMVFNMIGVRNTQDVEITPFFTPECLKECQKDGDPMTFEYECDLKVESVSRKLVLNNTKVCPNTLQLLYTLVTSGGVGPVTTEWEVVYHPSTGVTPAVHTFLGSAYTTEIWNRSNDIADFITNDLQSVYLKATITDASGCECEYTAGFSASSPAFLCGNSSNPASAPVANLCNPNSGTGLGGRLGMIVQNDSTGERYYNAGGQWAVFGKIITGEINVEVNGTHITGSPFQHPFPTHIYVPYAEYQANDTIVVTPNIVTDCGEDCNEPWTQTMIKP